MLGIIFLLSFGLGQCQLPWTALPGFYLNASVGLEPLDVALAVASEKDAGVLPFQSENLTRSCYKTPSYEPPILTVEERGAIACYTKPFPSPVFSRVNIALRSRNVSILNAWAPFLKLFHTGVRKLPAETCSLCRGINLHVYGDHQRGSLVTVDLSFSTDRTVCKRFASQDDLLIPGSKHNCTIVELTAISARYISGFSSAPGEEEYIMLPGTVAQVVLVVEQTLTACRTVYLVEIKNDQVPRIANVNNLLDDNLTFVETKEYNRFIRDYYKPSFVVIVGKSERLGITTQGGMDDPYNPLPYITNITYGQIGLSVNLSVGQILLGVNEYSTRGMLHEEVENLIESAKMDSKAYTNYTVASR